MQQNTKPIVNMPSQYGELYSAEDRALVEQVIAWINETGTTQAALARAAGVSPSTISQILAGRYPTDPSRIIASIHAAMQAQCERRSVQSVPFVETTVYKMMVMTCDRSRRYGNFGVLCGYVGVGKTAAIKRYARTHEHSILIESDPNMSPGVLLTELLTALSAPLGGSLAQKFSNVVRALNDTTKLIVIDEAETLAPQCLHYLRRIRDKAGIGIVLVGTEKLQALLAVPHGQFDQIRSRIGFIPAIVKALSRADADAIAQAALTDQGELEETVLEALWGYCQGSARMLVENFIPALRDYGLVRYPLSAELVDKIAESVLFMPVRRKAA